VRIEVRVVAELPVSGSPTLQYKYQTFARPDRREYHQLLALAYAMTVGVVSEDMPPVKSDTFCNCETTEAEYPRAIYMACAQVDI
jgi:hypothetical protein